MRMIAAVALHKPKVRQFILMTITEYIPFAFGSLLLRAATKATLAKALLISVILILPQYSIVVASFFSMIPICHITPIYYIVSIFISSFPLSQHYPNISYPYKVFFYSLLTLNPIFQHPYIPQYTLPLYVQNEQLDLATSKYRNGL